METLQRTANRGSVSTGYDVDNSAVFEADNSSYIRFTNISTYYSSARAKKFSNSIWVKRSALDHRGMVLSYSQSGYLEFNANHELNWIMAFRSGSSGAGTQKTLKSNALFRDTAAWYHIMVAVDTAQSTASDRVKIYVNGVQITSWATEQYPDQNDESANVYEQHNYIGTWGGGDHTNSGFCGYVAEFYFLSEIAASPTDFGEFDDNGIWIPKLYTAETITSPSSYLNFSNSSNLAEATSGQDWASGNVNNVEQATDTCTNNFCTWLSDGTLFNQSTDNETFKEGGTQFVGRAGTGWTAVYPTQMMAGGKWYMEVKVHENAALTMYGAMPVARINSLQYQEYYHGQDVDGSIGIYGDGGKIYYGTAGSGGAGSSLSAGDIVGLAIDMENYKMYFAVNNTYVESGNPAGNSNGRSIEQEPYVFSIANYSPNQDTETNFGGYTTFSNTHTNTDDNGFGNFVYAPPSGFLALCTKNLAETGG